MIPLATSLDTGSILSLGTLCVAIATAVVAYVKVKPEAESIATRTTLEVNESLREERAEAREEAAKLRAALRERDEEIALLQTKVTAMRQNVELLEAEVNALKNKTSKAREDLKE